MQEMREINAIARVAAFAAIAHNGQRRRGGNVPYIVHPARVAALVERFGGNYMAVIAAWLHDVVEDCPGYGPDVLAAFVNSLDIPMRDAKIIIDMVMALTKDMNIKPRRARLHAPIDAALRGPHHTALVKICDRIDNLIMNEFESVEDHVEEMPGKKFVKLYLEETKILTEGMYRKTHESGSGFFDAWSILDEMGRRMYGKEWDQL